MDLPIEKKREVIIFLNFKSDKKMKVGGKVVSIVQIKVTGKDKFTIAYLDWDNGKRPLLTRKIDKNKKSDNKSNEIIENNNINIQN